MMNTIVFSPEEVKTALLHYLNNKKFLYLPEQSTTIGFLDENEKDIEVHLVQIFREI